MPDRSNKDKRRLLPDAAVRVFARKGYHAARVGDIAEEADVAIDELLTGWLAPDHAGASA